MHQQPSTNPLRASTAAYSCLRPYATLMTAYTALQSSGPSPMSCSFPHNGRRCTLLHSDPDYSAVHELTGILPKSTFVNQEAVVCTGHLHSSFFHGTLHRSPGSSDGLNHHHEHCRFSPAILCPMILQSSPDCDATSLLLGCRSLEPRWASRVFKPVASPSPAPATAKPKNLCT